MLQYDRKRTFSLRWVLVGSVVVSFLIVLFQSEMMIEWIRERQCPGWTGWLEFIIAGLKDERMLFVLPVLAALPFASVMQEEYVTRFYLFVISRTSRRRYMVSKAIAACFSGGVVISTGSFLILTVSVVVMRIQCAIQGSDFAALDFMILLRICVTYFLLGSLFSVWGMLLSILFGNRYLSWLGPFIVTYLLVILCERYLQRCIILNPRMWIPAENWPLESWGICIWLFFLNLVSVACFFCVERICWDIDS